MAHTGEPLLDIHPTDAKRLGLVEGGFARVESRHGDAVLRVRLSTDQRRDEVFAPMHWTDCFTSAGPIDRVVGAATDPISGQPELKATPVRVTPVATLWRGMLLRQTEALPVEGPYYWARIPFENGHTTHLAGWEPYPGGCGTGKWILELLGAPVPAELIIYADPGRGIFRYASLVGDRLDACLFLARNTVGLPPRNRPADLMGTEIGPAERIHLLAGRPPDAGARRNEDSTVCACFAVGLNTLHSAIVERQLTSVGEIGALLRAGTNCGSCVPELEAILRGAEIKSASAA
jgi:assimilatory nitrate reductase catalytic subunit